MKTGFEHIERGSKISQIWRYLGLVSLLVGAVWGIEPGTIESSPSVAMAGGEVVLEATVEGAESFQWSFRGSAIAGAIGPTHTITGVSRADAGLYTVETTDGAGERVVTGFGLEVAASAMADLMKADVSFGMRFEREQAGEIRAVLALTDGGYLVGGDFSRFGGVERHFLVRISPDGSVDADWVPPRLSGAVNVIVQHPNGMIWVGGEFGLVEGRRSEGLARFSGDLELDLTNQDTPDSYGRVDALEVLSNGKVMAGGEFIRLSIGSTGRTPLIRLTAEGKRDPGFGGQTVKGVVRAIHELPDGRLLFGGGRYGTEQESSAGFIKLVYADGEPAGAPFPSPREFGVGGFFGPKAPVTMIRELSDGKILIGGAFSYVDPGSEEGHLLRYLADGSFDDTFTFDVTVDEMVEEVSDVAEIADGGLIVVGRGMPPVLVAQDGTVSQTLGELASTEQRLTDEGATGVSRWSEREGSDGRKRLGFTRYAVSGEVNTAREYESRRAAEVWQIDHARDGGIWVHGEFTHVNGAARRGVARINAAGELDLSFDAGDGWPLAVTGGLAMDGLGRLLIHDGVKLQRLLADGSRDESWVGPVYNPAGVAVARDGSILISNADAGGVFEQDNGVLKLTESGAINEAFEPVVVTGYVRDIFPQPKGSIHVFGQFGSINGMSASSGAVLDQNGVVQTGSTIPSGGNRSRMEARDGGGYAFWSFDSTGVEIYGETELEERYNNSYQRVISVLPLPLGGMLQFNHPDLIGEAVDQVFFFRSKGVEETESTLQIDGLDGTKTEIRRQLLLDDGSILMVGKQLLAFGQLQQGVMRLTAAQALAVVGQPQAYAGAEGDTVQLAVTVEGDGVLAYQWYRNGFAIDGAIEAGFELSSLSPADVGDYYVTVQGPFNTVTSATVRVGALASAPIIGQQPQSLVRVAGESAEFEVEVNGEGEISFQWRKDGVELPGQTTSMLVLDTVTRGSGGLYDVLVTRGLAETRSGVVSLEVNPTGKVETMFDDPSFAPNFSETGIPVGVTEVAFAPDRKLYVIGDFDLVNEQSFKGLVRLNFDGSIDPSFSVGTGFDGSVYSLIAQADGRVVVTGYFSTYDGVPVLGVVRLEKDGSLDESFNVDRPNANWSYTLKPLAWPDGGYLMEVGSATGGARLMRVDEEGRIDQRFSYQLDGRDIRAAPIEVRADGTITVWGTEGLQRLDENGAVLATYSGPVSAVSPRPDGLLYVGSERRVSRTRTDGSRYSFEESHVTRLNEDLSIDQNFSAAMPSDSSFLTSSFTGPSNLLVMPDGGVLVSDLYRMYRLSSDGALDEFFATSEFRVTTILGGRWATAGARVLMLNDEGSLLVSGTYMSVNGSSRPGLARLVRHDWGGIDQAPLPTSAVEGSPVSLSVQVSGGATLSYQWRRNGRAIEGATSETYALAQANFAHEGFYDVIITDGIATVATDPVRLSVTASGVVTRTMRTITHATNLGEDEPLFMSFRIEGAGEKRLMMRGVGPSLSSLGVSDAMMNPRLRLLDSAGGEIGSNDDWSDDPAMVDLTVTLSSGIGATPLAGGSQDAVIVQSVTAGNYILEIRGISAGTVLGEIYDVDDSGIGSRIVYGGVLIRVGNRDTVKSIGIGRGEDEDRDLLVRAVGPSTRMLSSLLDPNLRIPIGDTDEIFNDNWQFDRVMTDMHVRAGAWALRYESWDAALAYAEVGRSFFSANVGTGSFWVEGREHVLFEVYDLAARTPPLAPVLVVPPFDVSAPVGGAWNLSVVAHGAEDFTYTWFKDGIEIPDYNSPLIRQRVADLSGTGEYTVTISNIHGSITTSPVQVNVIQPPQIHTADTDGDNRLNLSELLRVIELYNTRFGTTRTGRYRVAEGTVDGFDPDATSNDAPDLLHHHLGDTDRDGRLSLSELLRVIELYNTRSGTTRTGAYRAVLGTADGFEPGL